MERVPDRGEEVDIEVNIEFAEDGTAQHGRVIVTINGDLVKTSMFTSVHTDLRAELLKLLPKGFTLANVDLMLSDMGINPQSH